MVSNQYFCNGASAGATDRRRERVVDDHHVAGEGISERRVGVDEHLDGRVGGADGLQVRGRLVGDAELAEEVYEVALRTGRSRLGRGLVGEADPADEISETACGMGGFCAA